MKLSYVIKVPTMCQTHVIYLITSYLFSITSWSFIVIFFYLFLRMEFMETNKYF